MGQLFLISFSSKNKHFGEKDLKWLDHNVLSRGWYYSLNCFVRLVIVRAEGWDETLQTGRWEEIFNFDIGSISRDNLGCLRFYGTLWQPWPSCYFIQTKTAQESKNFGCARNQLPACHMLWESGQGSTIIACGGGTSHTAQRCHAFLLSESRIYWHSLASEIEQLNSTATPLKAGTTNATFTVPCSCLADNILTLFWHFGLQRT